VYHMYTYVRYFSISTLYIAPDSVKRISNIVDEANKKLLTKQTLMQTLKQRLQQEKVYSDNSK